MNNRILWAAAALLVASATVSEASAQNVDARASETPHIHVSFNDLNLNTAAGKAQLDRRILSAARAICGPSPSIGDLQAISGYRACIKATIATAGPSAEQAAILQGRSRTQLTASRAN